MSDYQISPVYPGDTRTLADVKALLQQEGIRLDSHVDYTCVMYDEEYHAIATGSCFGNTLRCFAVDEQHQGEGLLNTIITHLLDIQQERGNYDLFLYTKVQTTRFFQDLGFAGNVNDYYDPRNTEAGDYAALLKLRAMLRTKSASATGEARLHYELLLRNIEKALKK